MHVAVDARARDEVVHPVQGAQERGLAAARRADERRHLRWPGICSVMSFERALRAVVEGERLHVDACARGRSAAGGRVAACAAPSEPSGAMTAALPSIAELIITGIL